MASRHELHNILVGILASFEKWLWDPFDFESDDIEALIRKGAEEHVYFQPTENVRMSYPCIVYKGDGGDSQHADNIPYVKKRRYMITVIDQDPDSKISEKVSDLSSCTYERDYTSDNLNHFVYNIYF